MQTYSITGRMTNVLADTNKEETSEEGTNQVQVQIQQSLSAKRTRSDCFTRLLQIEK